MPIIFCSPPAPLQKHLPLQVILFWVFQGCLTLAPGWICLCCFHPSSTVSTALPSSGHGRNCSVLLLPLDVASWWVCERETERETDCHIKHAHMSFSLYFRKVPKHCLFSQCPTLWRVYGKNSFGFYLRHSLSLSLWNQRFWRWIWVSARNYWESLDLDPL